MSVNIAINNIKEEEFKFSGENIDFIDRKLLSLDFHLRFKVNKKKNLFTVRFTAIYNYGNKENNNLIQLLKFSTSTRFKIKGLKKIIKFDNEERFQIPDPLMMTFVGAAISSTRGMLAYKLSGTILSDFYLPLVDVKKLLKIYDMDSDNEK